VQSPGQDDIVFEFHCDFFADESFEEGKENLWSSKSSVSVQ
jgi:hypothetical protein